MNDRRPATGFDRNMRVVITGATGNVGTSVIEALAQDARVRSIVGLARRRPIIVPPKTAWIAADVTTADLVRIFRGADAVVHLAWMIQPSRDIETMRRANVRGSERVFRATTDAGVPALVYASSVGVYSPGPKDRRVDESWPTYGIPTSTYSSQKSEVERLLDAFEQDLRVVRLRKALVFKREAASEIRRLFLGPLFPASLLHPKLIRAVPRIPRLRFQAVHSKDVGQAYRLAILGDARGAFNIAAEPVIDPSELARMFGAWQVPVPARVVRALVSAAWHLRMQPSEAGWLDLALETPLLDTTRARRALGWSPRHSSRDALLEILEGMRLGSSAATPPLSASTSASFQVRRVPDRNRPALKGARRKSASG
ncbi:MAG: NAD-dependent epimerase/dehydratase family protein [Candidatus Binatia bacterium]